MLILTIGSGHEVNQFTCRYSCNTSPAASPWGSARWDDRRASGIAVCCNREDHIVNDVRRSFSKLTIDSKISLDQLAIPTGSNRMRPTPANAIVVSNNSCTSKSYKSVQLCVNPKQTTIISLKPPNWLGSASSEHRSSYYVE